MLAPTDHTHRPVRLSWRGFSGAPLDASAIAYWVLFGLLAYLLLSPLALLLVSTVKSSPDALPFETDGVTLENWAAVYLDPDTYKLLLNTAVFATGSLAVGFSFALGLAWLLVRTDLPGKWFGYAIVLVPLCTPGMLYAISWILLLNPRSGLVNLALQDLFSMTGDGPLNVYSMAGMVFIEGVRMVPSIFLMLSVAFKNMDPALEEAATLSGAGGLAVARRITVPLAKPALLGALIYYFVTLIEVFDVPGLIGQNAGINVFSTQIYWATHPEPGLPDYGQASTLSMVLVVVALALISLYHKVIRSSDYAVVRGKAYRPREIALGRAKWLGLLLVLAYFVVAVLLPLLVLLWASLQPYFSAPTWDKLARVSLSAYRALWQHPQFVTSLRNTFLVAGIAATATIAIATLSAWFVVRSRFRSRLWMERLAFLPQAIPSIIIGLAVLLTYLVVPIPIYGTIWIIVIGHVTSYLAYGSRSMLAAVTQLHPELEEAAQMSGASPSRMLARVSIPLLFPALVNGWIWVAVHSMRELSISLMLYTPSTVLFSTLLWSFWQNGDIAASAALGVVLILTIGLSLSAVMVALSLCAHTRASVRGPVGQNHAQIAATPNGTSPPP